MSEREKTEGRFHILQPNRDLESNWAVDVAKQLEEYLLEICSNAGLGNDGCPAVNFAEAALLLQGSIQVYSRKVEYLYTLVVHALEFISQKRQDVQEKGSIQPDGTDVDAVGDDDNEEFLSLDDVQVEANIDLDDDLGSDNPSFNRPVKPPASLLVLEGECLDATSDMGELSSYQIAISSLHRDFLLLDPCDSEAVDNFLKANNVCSNLQMSTQRGSSTRSKFRRSFFQSPIRHGSAQKSGLGKGQDLEMNGIARENCSFEADNNSGLAPNCRHDFPDDSTHGGEDMGGGFSELEDLDDDPWVPLNPHEPGTLKVKPFKKANLVCRLRSFSKQKIALAKFPCARLCGTVNPEFADAMNAVERLRATQSPVPYQKLRESLVSGIHEASDAFPEPNNDIEDNDCVNDQYVFEETDTGLFHDSYMDNEAAAFSGVDDIGGMSNNHSTANEDLNATTSLEDLCRSHLDALLARIAESEKQTELAAHVSTWKQRIEHSLEEQELHPPFDIHEYGEKFMAELSSETDFGGSRSFAELIGGQPKYEIARTFSALLQLVNNGNVALDKGKTSNEPVCFTAVNPFYVKLLSNNRKHEEMLNYRAPSVARKLDARKKRTSSPAKNFDEENHLLDGTSTTLLASPTKLSPSSGKSSYKAGKGRGIKCTPEGKRRRRSQFMKNIAFAR